MANNLKHRHIDRITHNTLEQVLKGLSDELLDQGYTPSEIKFYILDKVEQSSEYTKQAAELIQQDDFDVKEEDSKEFFRKINEGLGIRF